MDFPNELAGCQPSAFGLASGPYRRLHFMSTPFGHRQLKAMRSAYDSILNKQNRILLLVLGLSTVNLNNHEGSEVNRVPYMQSEETRGELS